MSHLLDEDAVKRILKELFPCLPGISELPTGNFEADFVLKIAGKTGITPELMPISFWHAFQTTSASFDEKFKALIFVDPSPDHNYIILSDILAKPAVCFKRSEVDEVLDNATDIDFFQPVDYLIVCIELKKMTVIHHSGYIFSIVCKY